MTIIGSWILKGVLIGAAVIGFFAIKTPLGLQDDSPIEQFIESEIKQETGITIDLSPDNLSIAGNEAAK